MTHPPTKEQMLIKQMVRHIDYYHILFKISIIIQQKFNETRMEVEPYCNLVANRKLPQISCLKLNTKYNPINQSASFPLFMNS